jgi:hypothetical protein
LFLSGPLVVYENSQFNNGTKAVFSAIATVTLHFGQGAETPSPPINQYDLNKKFSYISTAGGALMEFLMGKKLPGRRRFGDGDPNKQFCLQCLLNCCVWLMLLYTVSFCFDPLSYFFKSLELRSVSI